MGQNMKSAGITMMPIRMVFLSAIVRPASFRRHIIS